MVRSPLLWKILAALAALVAFSSVLAWLFAAPRVAEDVRAQTRALLRAKASLLAELAAPALADPALAPDLQERLRRAASAADARLSVIRLDGAVIADSERDPGTLEAHLPEGRPEIRDALASGVGEDARTSVSVRDRLMYVALRVDAEGGPLGVVRAAQPIRREEELRSRLLLDIALGSVLAGMAAFAIAWFVAGRITRPLRSVMSAAASIAAGQYDRRVPASPRDELGRLGLAFNTMADQLKDRMETISRERRELRAILAGMVEGVVAVDAAERVVILNDAAGRILGAGSGPSEGRPIWEVTRLTEVGETLAEAVRTGEPTQREARLPRTPRDRFLRLHAAPLREPDGAPAGAVLVVHDISELRHLEMVRRDFVANVSHELKTPLTAVRGFVETILEDDAMEPATRRRFLGRIHDQTLRLSKMVEELLSLSRVESPESDVARVPTDLRVAVRAALEAVTRASQEKVQDLRAEIPDAPVVVPGNEEALRRIAGNLLDNAVKYTPPGGRVAVRLVVEAAHAVLEVEDTGPGIPERDRERVFERFYRVDKGRSRDAGGTGLGLAIVKHLVRALGGSVGVEGAPSGGSLFRVRLPRVP